MSFLGVAPWLAWSALGLTAAAITVIFFLRIQHRQVVVSSSLLWARVLERRKTRSWLEILRRVISLLIALTIGLSLVLVFTEAETGSGGGAPRRVAVVIDTSPSMGTRTADGATRLDKASALAGRLLSGGSAADTFVVYDTNGRVLAPASRDRTGAREALQQLRALPSEFSFPDLESGFDTWLITDGVGAIGIPDQVKVLSVFEPADNVGVSAFEVRPMPTDRFRYEAFLEVGNFSPGPKEVTIALQDDRQVQFRRTVQLQPNEFYRNTFDLSPLEGGALQARVSADGDALPLDNEAWAFLPHGKSVRIGLVGPDDSAVAEALGAESHVELTRLSATEYEDWVSSRTGSGIGGMAPVSAAADPGPLDGLVFAGYAPAQPPFEPALLIAPPAANWLPIRTGRVDEPGDVLELAADPLLEFVDVHDLRIERADVYEAGEARVLASAGDVPILLMGDEGASWVMLTFELERSDFAQSLAFAIFLSNLIEWFRDEAPMVRALPGAITIPLAHAAVTSPGGGLAETRQLPGRTVFEAHESGVYMAHGGRRTLPVVVAANGRRVSAVNRQVLVSEPIPVEEVPSARVLWPLLLPLVAALLALEGLTYHRRITI